MDASVVASPAADVRALIARRVLTPHSQQRLGTITLAPHQTEAVFRINSAIREFRGAFLCDAVGSGKTYIGLAVASHWQRPVVIAPAALREMWRGAIAAACVNARVMSIESLSRSPSKCDDCDGFIVDEAHHFRNSRTIRYRVLSRILRRAPVVMMTATPIHNSRRDFENLAAIFLGSRARRLSALEIGRLIVRRDTFQARIRLPEVQPTEWLEIADDETTVADLVALPTPVPLSDAGDARALLAHGLIRQWASSEAALDAALRRRVLQAIALENALESGTHPTREEIRSWLQGEDSVQLVLPDLFAVPLERRAPELLRAVRAHSAAVSSLTLKRRDQCSLDDQRSELLGRILRAHSSTRVVAFSSYEATVGALFTRLLHSHRVACLTSRGARVAGGRISRDDAIRQFSPASPEAKDAERIDLLLTTDLLSEGVNLQNAGIVVHLDVPWTAARLEQRVGRVARLGSRSRNVLVFGMKPPLSAERALRAAAIVEAKWFEAANVIGAGQRPGFRPAVQQPRATPHLAEAIRQRVRAWVNGNSDSADATLMAAVRADRNGFLAVLETGSEYLLLCDNAGVSTEPADVHAVVSIAEGPDAPLHSEARDAALQKIRQWMLNTRSAELAGLGKTSFLRARRKLFARINSFAAHNPPEARFIRQRAIERARLRAFQIVGCEDERALESFDLSDAELFEEESLNAASAPEPAAGYRLCALLVLIADAAETASQWSTL